MRLFPVIIIAACAAGAAEYDGVRVAQDGRTVSIANARIAVRYDLDRGLWSAAETNGVARIQSAAAVAGSWRSDAAGVSRSFLSEPLADALGMGRSLLVTATQPGGPKLLLRISLYQDQSFIALSAGLENTTPQTVQLKRFSPMTDALAFPGEEHRVNYSVLDGNGGGAKTFVSHDPGTRLSLNNLLVTFGPPGAARSLVMGGLTYNEFEKYAQVTRAGAELNVALYADDPVGKRIDPGTRYLPPDRFYLDFTTRNPFTALETYAERVRLAQNVVLPVYHFPILDLWFAQVDHFGAGMDRAGYHAYNDTPGAVEEMEVIARSGFLKYTPVAVLLEPDLYDPNNQQGWWDDEHFRRGPDVRAKGNWKNNSNGQYVAPYHTSLRWAGAVRALGGIPMIYMQTGFRSQDYAEKFPQHMLHNGPDMPHLNDRGEQQYRDRDKKIPRKLGYDYTDPGFIAHMREVWENLRLAGIRGVKFDYPDYPFTGWPSGGMEDPYATTAMHYRNVFQLARDGLGLGSWIHERTLARGSDISLGLVASQRTEGDTDLIEPKMVTRVGLRWYKNRTIMNYDMDGKNVFHAVPANRDGERAMLTMSYVVSGTLMVVPSFGRMSRDQLHDLSRLYPYHAQRRSARPIDAFTSDQPRIYDLAVSPDWHQLALFNFDTANETTIAAPLAALELDAAREYYVYDFWNDRLVGKLRGGATLEQKLRPGEARMLSIHAVDPHPQFIATDRHLMQGYVDLLGCEWNAEKRELEGVSQVVGGETYRVILATNGMTPVHRQTAVGVQVRRIGDGLAEVAIHRPENGPVAWKVHF